MRNKIRVFKGKYGDKAFISRNRYFIFYPDFILASDSLPNLKKKFVEIGIRQSADILLLESGTVIHYKPRGFFEKEAKNE